MHRFSSLLLVASTALLVDAAPALAQAAEPAGALPFRRGQWGTEFGVSTDFPSVGFFRFFSDRNALLLDVDVNYIRYTDEFDSPAGPIPNDDYSESDVTARLGIRHYRPIVDRVVGVSTFGVIGSRFAEWAETEDEAAMELSGFEGGVFGELGGAWMVTRNLSLGGSYQAAATFFNVRQEVEGAGEAKRNGFTFGAGQARLLVTLYF